MEPVKEELSQKPALSRSLLLLMSIAGAVSVANLYDSQPLLAGLAQYFHVSSAVIGVAAMLTQIGNAIGLIFLVPFGDIVRHRLLIITMLACSMAALSGLSFASSILWFAVGSLLVGITSITQILLVTLAAHLADPASRGRVIGTVMTGLLFGMLLSRTFSGIVGEHWGWRAVYRIAAVMMGILIVVFYFRLPRSSPGSSMSYGKLLASLGGLLRRQPVLRSSSLIGAMMFATFSAFWATLSFLLESPAYRLGAQAAGMFGLLGTAGALAASAAGRVSDRKGPLFTLTIGICLSMASFLCLWIFGTRMQGLICGIILLDLGVQTAQISNQAKINALDAASRSRNNAIYMALYFVGGALGSFLGSYFWGLFGWTGVCALGVAFQGIAAAAHFREFGHALHTQK